MPTLAVAVDGVFKRIDADVILGDWLNAVSFNPKPTKPKYNEGKNTTSFDLNF